MPLDNDKIFYFRSFKDTPCLIHGFSTRDDGNLKFQKRGVNFLITKALQEFANKLKISPKRIVFMEQIHGQKVKEVTKKDSGTWTPIVDGLVTKEKDLYLAVNIADCVPLFFVEPNAGIIGIIHAGWKGTLAKIAENAVNKIVQLRGRREKIKVGIGPHIGKCCYRVPKERFDLFRQKFGNDPIFGECKGGCKGGCYLDLAAINVKILLKSGIRMENIEAPITCTSCQNNLFFSFRKDSKNKYGEMLGVIGIKA